MTEKKLKEKFDEVIEAAAKTFSDIDKLTERYHSGVYQTVPTQKSEDVQELVNLYRELEETLDKDKYYISFKQGFIKIGMNSDSFDLDEEEDKDTTKTFDYSEYISSLTDYMRQQGMEIYPKPKVTFAEEKNNELFRPTAHYDPSLKEITLYVAGRAPKDVLRSFAHEMIHHEQNLANKLEKVETTDINEDDYLREIEEEAYLKGNIMFRSWEDNFKNTRPNK